MTSDNDFARLRLIRSVNVGPVTYRQLIQRFGTAKAALAALPDLIARGGGKKFALAKERDIQAEIQAVHVAGAQYLFLGDTGYPELLAHMENAPPVFCYRGNLELFDRSSVAMVGARNASAGACRFARILAHGLGQRGVSVISGLARGIDSAAHMGSIDTGTIAVIAGGIDSVYPPENAKLQHEIAARGLLIAEMPAGTEPRARHFPYRNRIIAGLTLGTVVVEAAPRSGSLITARLAAEAGREVMAVPGSPLDPRAKGCNQLIRDGATLVQDADDIIEIIRPFDMRMQPSVPKNKSVQYSAVDANDGDRQKLINLLSMAPVHIDELVRQSGLSASTVQLVLLELELAGRLERGAGATLKLTG